MDPKKPWQSKQLWVSLVVAIAAFIPSVHAFVVANPEIAGGAVGFIFAVLRLVSGGKISLQEPAEKP